MREGERKSRGKVRAVAGNGKKKIGEGMEGRGREEWRGR